MIIKLSRPSKVMTSRYLLINASITIKVAYDHTCIVFTSVVVRRVKG